MRTYMPRPLQRQTVGTLRGAGTVQHAAFRPYADKAAVFPRLVFVLVLIVAVAIERRGTCAAQIDRAGQPIVVVEPVAGGQGHQAAAVLGLIGIGEDRLAPLVVHALRDQAVADQIVVGMRQRESQIGGVGSPGELAEQLAHLGRRMVTPAVLIHAFGGQVPGELLMATTLFDCTALASERAAVDFRRATWMGIATFGLQRQRTAQGVQAVQRVRARHQGHVGNGGVRDQVPVHHIAERFVDSHAVEENRKPLRRTEQRRGGEATIVEVRLVRIALDLVDVDAGQSALQFLG